MHTILSGEIVALIAPFVLAFVVAGGFHMHVWNKYRNTDKSYAYESTTAIDVTNVGGYDEYAYDLNRTRDNEIDNRGRSVDPRQRL